tara:strand:- start:106 stop:288 length:183 start_codon:yes stop_codon:yes gene_type:complete
MTEPRQTQKLSRPPLRRRRIMFLLRMLVEEMQEGFLQSRWVNSQQRINQPIYGEMAMFGP